MVKRKAKICKRFSATLRLLCTAIIVSLNLFLRSGNGGGKIESVEVVKGLFRCIFSVVRGRAVAIIFEVFIQIVFGVEARHFGNFDKGKSCRRNKIL